MSVAEFISGTLFGSALLASGVSSPSVIISQLSLRDTHMLQAFVAASGVSAIVISLAAKYDVAPCRVRAPANYGYFPYDANLIGGLLIGAGMATTGACPGTVVAQIGVGIRSGTFVGIGALLGGALFTRFGQQLRRSPIAKSAPKQLVLDTKSSAKVTSYANSEPTTGTMQELMKMNTESLLFSYESLCACMLLTIQVLAPSKHANDLHPLAGGLLIGAAQAATVLLTHRAVGVSTAYHDLGRRFWRSLDPKLFPNAALLTPAVTFAAGIVAGSWTLARSGTIGVPDQYVQIADWKALLGGVYMVFGAGLAGGCPSGHGISGLATFSVSSFISVAAMFGGGIAVATALEAFA